MKYFISMICYIMLVSSLYAQTSTTVTITVLDKENKQPVYGASVYINTLSIGSNTNEQGIAILNNVPTGTHELTISYIGFTTITESILVSNILLEKTYYLAEGFQLEAITVKATRSTRTIKRIPTRVEFIGGEELGEKATMNAANISMVLRESTGIQIQQTSLSSANSTIKIQGLDGRYTQLLKDGFPLFGGFSGGLSVMQIPPLDLQQFEIIKGSSSTLYGGGAIAGLVNMVSKTPDTDPELDIMLTQTHVGGSTGNIFYSKRNSKFGTTLYASGNYQKIYDPEDDDFSNLPKTKTFSFNPKIFYYPNEKETYWLGINGTYDKREGGDVTAINNGISDNHQYTEDNTSARISTQAVYTNKINKQSELQIKNSISHFNRELTTQDYQFSGKQWNTFTEVNYTHNNDQSDWIIGANLYSNSFKEANTTAPRNQQDITTGLFANYTRDLSEKFILETGLRTDYSPDWGFFPLPRISLLYNVNNHFSSRIGGGLGYKIPDMFTEEAAVLNYQNITAINKDNLEAERSYGVNIDLNYSGNITNEISVSFNQLFYITRINNALLLNSNDNFFYFENADGAILSKGAETNLKFSYKDFRWFLNYTYIDATLNYLPGKPQKTLTPKHMAGNVIMYENEKWRIGFETYYTGKQRLSNGNKSNDYLLFGFLIQKHFDWISPYMNFENFTDRRQSKFSPEILPPHTNPEFAEIYAPTDGFIFSAGVIIRPFGNNHHDEQ